MKHPVSGEIKEISLIELLGMFDVSVRERVVLLAGQPWVAAVAVMENLQMDSSHFGDRVALALGPDCTFQVGHLEQAGFRLGDVPSRFQYPVAIYIKPV